MTEKAVFRLPLLRAPLAAPSTGLELAAVGARPWVLAGPERLHPHRTAAPRAPRSSLRNGRVIPRQRARPLAGPVLRASVLALPLREGTATTPRATGYASLHPCSSVCGRPGSLTAGSPGDATGGLGGPVVRRPRALSEGAPAGRAAPVFLPDNARMCGTTAFGSHSFEFRCLSQTEL